MILAAMEAPRKKAAERNRCSGMSNLPRPILMEILCRLPIKTLLSCQSVCKLWLNLISTDSDFAKLHLQKSPTELLFHSNSYPCENKRFYMGNIHFENNSAPNLKLSPLFDLPRFSVTRDNFVDYRDTYNVVLRFVNSCNGLVFFESYIENHFAVICNPIRGDFITIPAPECGKHMPNLDAYGLGFSGKANRYKLLRLMLPDNSYADSSSKQFAEILTIEKGSSWRNVGDIHYRCQWGKGLNPVFLEGKLYMSSLVPGSLNTAISCFDLDDELFEQIPLPPAVSCFGLDDEPFGEGPLASSSSYWSGITIGILGSCLFFSHFRYNSNNGVDIWVMKEYGVKDSWTKAFSIAKYPLSQSYIEMHIPIQHLDIGEILMLHHDVDLVLHNQDGNSIRTIGRIDNLEVNAYCPTLLLLKDALMGYDTPVHNVKSRYADLERQNLATIRFWKFVEKNYVQKSPRQQGSKAPLTNDVAVTGEERNGHVSPTSEFSARESSKALSGHGQGTDALTSDKIHVPTTEEERHGPVCETGLVQTLASSSVTQVTTAVLWGKMKALVDNLGEELRKERQQRQELEQRLQNEVAKVEPLKEQTEHLKQHNQQLEQRLKNEVAKAEPLKEQTEHLKQQNQQLEQTQQRLQNEVAKVEPLKEQTEHLKQQNQQLGQSLQNEQAKVEQLKEQIKQSEQFKQENQQMMLQMMDEMRAQLGGSQ